jgi:hypothetical protein
MDLRAAVSLAVKSITGRDDVLAKAGNLVTNQGPRHAQYESAIMTFLVHLT